MRRSEVSAFSGAVQREGWTSRRHFGVCHHLRRAGRLSEEDDKLFAEVDAWFDRELPTPPFYADGNSIKAITWFKQSATHLIEALAPLRDMLDRYQVPYDVVRTDDPGIIVYEDEFQVAVVAASPRHPQA